MEKRHWISVEFRMTPDKEFGYTRAYPLDGGPEEDVKGMVLTAINDYEASKNKYPDFEWRLNYKYF
jgi:hypothetical protein